MVREKASKRSLIFNRKLRQKSVKKRAQVFLKKDETIEVEIEGRSKRETPFRSVWHPSAVDGLKARQPGWDTLKRKSPGNVTALAVTITDNRVRGRRQILQIRLTSGSLLPTFRGNASIRLTQSNNVVQGMQKF